MMDYLDDALHYVNTNIETERGNVWQYDPNCGGLAISTTPCTSYTTSIYCNIVDEHEDILNSLKNVIDSINDMKNDIEKLKTETLGINVVNEKTYEWDNITELL